MPVRRGGFRVFADQYAQANDEEFVLDAEQEDAVGEWFSDVKSFCLGTWPLKKYETKTRPAVPIIWTQDKLAEQVRPFPDYDYLFEGILRPIFEAPRLDASGRPIKYRYFIPKPRQMFVTNGILGGCLYHVLKQEASEFLIAKNKLPEAARFIKERVRFMYRRMPAWFSGQTGPRARLGFRNVAEKPAGRFVVDETLSAITPVAQNFGSSGEAVGETASLVGDECVRIRNLPAVYAAADAMAPIIILVSAPPERGMPVDPLSLAFFREMFEGLEAGTLMKTVVGRSDLVPQEDDDDSFADVSALERIGA